MHLTVVQHARRCCARALLAIGILAPVLHAQARSTHPSGGNDASRLAPVVLQRGRFRVMLATPSSLEWTRAHDGTATAIARCASALNIDSASARAATAASPWATTDSTELGRSELVVQVVGQPLSAAECGLDAALDPGLIARGVALVAGRYADPSGSVANITLRRSDGTLLAPQRSVLSSPTYLGSATPAGAADPMMERGYFGAGSIVPRRDGTFDSVVLVIVAASGDTTSVPVPGTLLERIWPGVVAARLSRSPAGGDTIGALSLPTPHDAVLRMAHDQFATGASHAAALRSAQRLTEARLTVLDELAARLMIASELLAERDTAAAAATLAPSLRPVPALAAAPCLQLAGSAPAVLRKLIDDLRPPQRCEELGAARTMLRGLVLPGGSQLANGQRASGYVVAGFVAAAGVGALVLHQRADQQYHAYQGVTNPILVPDAYQRANDTRHAVVGALTAGAAVWVAAAIEGGIAAALHDRDLHRVQHYGASPVVHVSGERVGLGLGMSFGRGNS